MFDTIVPVTVASYHFFILLYLVLWSICLLVYYWYCVIRYQHCQVSVLPMPILCRYPTGKNLNHIVLLNSTYRDTSLYDTLPIPWVCSFGRYRFFKIMYISIRLYSYTLYVCNLFAMKTCCRLVYLNKVVFYTAYVCGYNFGRCRSVDTVQSISLSICCVLIEYNFVSTPIILHCYTVPICIPQNGCILTQHMICEQYRHCTRFAYICSVRIQSVSIVLYVFITSILSLDIIVRVSEVLYHCTSICR